MRFQLNSKASHAVGLNNLRSLLPKWGVYLGYALVLASFFSSPAKALFLQDIETEVRYRVKDSAASRTRFSQDLIDTFINQGQRDVVTFAMPLYKTEVIVLAQGTTYYTIPTDVMAIERVTFQNKNVPEQTLTSLDSIANYAAWEQSGGPPTAYFQDPSRSSSIGVYPFPNTASSTGTLRVMYAAQVQDLVSGLDVPFNAEARFYPYHDILIYYAVYNLLYIDGEIARAQEFKAIYEVRLKAMIDSIGARPNYKPGFSGPNPR